MPPKTITCSVCSQIVLKSQTLARADSSRACKSHEGVAAEAEKLAQADAARNVATLRMPEFEDIWEERVVKGKLVRVCKTHIKWPAGTVHGSSKYARGTAHNSQCHACGHAIRNAFNWVPFLMDDAKGVPHSMWVGRDCAKNIFNVDMKGDAEYENSGCPGVVEVRA